MLNKTSQLLWNHRVKTTLLGLSVLTISVKVYPFYKDKNFTYFYYNENEKIELRKVCLKGIETTTRKFKGELIETSKCDPFFYKLSSCKSMTNCLSLHDELETCIMLDRHERKIELERNKTFEEKEKEKELKN